MNLVPVPLMTFALLCVLQVIFVTRQQLQRASKTIYYKSDFQNSPIAALGKQRIFRSLDYIEVPGSDPIDVVKTCRTDDHCSTGYFCNLNATSPQFQSCIKCFDCATKHRFQGPKKCSKNVNTCGPCLQSFTETAEGLCRYTGCSYGLVTGLAVLAVVIISGVILACLHFKYRTEKPTGKADTTNRDKSDGARSIIAQGFRPRPTINPVFCTDGFDSHPVGSTPKSSAIKGLTSHDGLPLLVESGGGAQQWPSKSQPPDGVCCRIILWFLEAF